MQKIKDLGSTFFYILIMILIWGGWIACIFRFFTSDFEAPYKAEIIYGVTMFTPIAPIIGWMDFGK